MANRDDVQRLARDLAVPVLMLVGVSLYAWDVRHLSLDGLVFPGGLIAVIVVASIVVIVQSVLGRSHPHPDPAPGPLHAPLPWLLVLIPIPLIWIWEYSGALLALVGTVSAAQFLLGGRSVVRNAAFSILTATPVYLLFKYLFYVRFPAGHLGIG